MRRGVITTAVVLLALTAALWVAARLDRAGSAGARRAAPLPEVVAGRDLGPLDAPAPAPARDAATAAVRCAYDGEGAPGILVAVGEEVLEGASGDAELALALPPGRWSLAWRRTDGRTVPLGGIDAAAGDIHTCRLGDAGWEVRGRVLAPDGHALDGAVVQVCGRRVRTDADGAFVAAARGGACEVRAVVRDGMLSRRGEPVTVGPFDAGALELVVDDAPIAGMGIAFRMSESGARVLYVHPDTPAEAAGVETDDLIVAIDGTPVPGLSEDGFIALGTGRAGTTVTLTLEQEGERFEVRFARAPIAARDTGAP